MTKATLQKCLGMLALLSISSVSCFANTSKTLNMLNWTGYMPPTTLTQFEQKTGMTVNYSMFASDDGLYTKINLAPKSYDLIAPTSYMIPQLAKAGLLKKLDKMRLRYYKNLNPLLTHSAPDPHGNYCIPNYWGTTGIIVNKQYFNPNSITTWADLWQKRFRGKLLIPDDPREIFNIALISLGYSPNDQNPKHITQAYEKLKKLLPNIKVFNEAAESALFADGDVTVGISLSGDAFHASLTNPNITYIYPKEGVAIWLDCLAIPKFAPTPKNAYRFLNTIMQPSTNKTITLFAGFATANLDAVKLLPTAIRDNKTLYPSAVQLKHATVENVQKQAIRDLITHDWELLKLQT